MASDKKTAAGNTSMLLLQLLSERDMYGYEMIETLGKRSENLFELKAGTLYPLLHTMESQKLLFSYEAEVMGKVRKYYGITKEGRIALEEKKKEWQFYNRAVSRIIGGELCGACLLYTSDRMSGHPGTFHKYRVP